jgi:XTP/dITP diphosphohydrolase
MHSRQEKLEAFGKLLDIMDDLREKCPWDQKQSFESLRHLTIEETYELADAIVEGDIQELKKEIGDILLHMVFYSKIASETKDFDIADVLHSICEKLIHRHPHIYGDVKVANEEEVKANWEKLKLKEGKKSVLEGVPKSLPSLVKAVRIQDKARGVGFDWDNKDQVWAKVQEELAELIEAEEEGKKENIEAEFGDVLFSLINYGRFLKVDPEMALERTNKKFIKRFQDMEAWVVQDNKKLSEMSLDEMDTYWERSKRTE